jgi:molybdopterin-guanine dinucleotide biosynthesis protein A
LYKDYLYDVIILAGGKSKRFGSFKCVFNYLGRPLIYWIAKEFENPIIVTRRELINDSLRELGTIVIENGEYNGPVGGVMEGIKFVESSDVFIIGCDYPYFIRRVSDLICSREGEIRSPIINNLPQPLLGCYKLSFLKNVLPYINKLLDLYNFAKEIYYLGVNEIRIADPTLRSIVNINTLTDFYNRVKYFSISKLMIK